MESTAVVHVPFRCPDCGDSVQFESLKDLRLHLQVEHADLTFQNKKQSGHFPPGLFSNRSATPILEMYHADAVRIEDDLLMHKRNEINNKQRRMNSISPSRIPNVRGMKSSRSSISNLDRHTNQNPASFRQYGHSSLVEHKHLNKSKGDKVIKLNTHTHFPTNGYLDNSFNDDESLNDATRPDISVARNLSRQNNKVHNISSTDVSTKNMRNSRVSSVPVQIPESVSSDLDNHVRETLTSLSQEVVVTRANQQAAVDSLLASQEVYSFLENSAQEKMCKQQEIIANLALKLSEKDEKLADLTVQVNRLKNQSTEEEVKNIIRMKSNQESEKILQDELFYKQKEMVSLKQRVENAKLSVLKNEQERKNKNEDVKLKDKENTQKPEREMNVKPVKDDESGEDNLQEKESVSFPVNQARLVERDMLAKEKELVSLRSKSMQLESDRQTLLLEMQALLEIAAHDNEKLRAELANQGKQLSKLNLELERSKQEQSELLGETNTLYFQADLSLSRLKHVLEERDSQLSSVSAQLDQAKDMQARLTKEREEYLKVAVEKEASYQVLVQENALQLKIMRESLDKRQVEKEKLQEKLRAMKNELAMKEKEDVHMVGKMRDMEEQLAEQEAWQVSMKEQIKKKEERLHSARKSMDQMNIFMGDTAKKELEARSRLEQFISSLIDRSTQTEAELKKLREAYEAKEKAFNRLIQAQEDQLSSNTPHISVNSGGLLSSHPSWQGETRVEIQNLSSYPSPIDSRKLNGLSNPQMSPSYHRRHIIADYDSDQDDDIQEPTRLRSTINQVKKQEIIDVVSSRQLKNRPILVQGREYPHPSAYGVKRPLNPNSRNANSTIRPSEEEYLYNTKRGQDKLKRGSLTRDKFYLPVEKDEYAIRPTESRQGMRKRSSSPTNSYIQLGRNEDGTHHRLNNSVLFKNTPEVDKMYENVQKYSYTSNPSNQLPKRNFLPCQHHLHYGSQKSQRLPMDEQGIIWDPHERSGLRARVQKKKVKRKTNVKSSKRDNLNKNADSVELKGSCESDYDDDDDAVPTVQNSNRLKRSSQATYSVDPTPLGDKIALLLTSIGPGTVASNARREYEGYPSTTTPRLNNERDVHSPNMTSESDSQQSSPIHNARAVRERVEKLTARQIYNDDNVHRDMSRTPKNVNQFVRFDPEIHPPNNVGATRNEDKRGPEEYMERTYLDRETYQKPGVESPSRDNSDVKLSVTKGYSLQSMPEKPLEGYYNRFSSNHDYGDDDEVVNQTTRPNIEVVNIEDDQRRGREVLDDSYTMQPPQHTTDDVDGMGYQSSLLKPYMADTADQFESHNAESDFSSSSYATLRPDTSHHGEDYTEYAQDTQDEVDDVDNTIENIEPNAQEIQAEVHRELENDDSMTGKLPSVSEVREMYQDSPTISRESYFSRSSDSNQKSLQQNDDVAKSENYDTVMKELLDKHPFVYGDSQELEETSTPVRNEVTEESESSEYLLDEDVERSQQDITSEETESVQAHVQEYEASENDLVSSDDNDDERARSLGSQGTLSRSSSKADTIDASTDTDLEKLALPGAIHKPLDARRKKKKNSAAWNKEKKTKKQKSTPKLKDMAKSSWTSVDVNDSDVEREERLQKRRFRVALFCALAYADTKTLLSASQVCKDWRKITQHPALWKHIELKDSQISSQFLITLSQWCTQAETISLQGLTGRSQRLMESDYDYNKDIRGSLEQGLERLLFACQATLKSLTIQGCENILTDKCLWLVSSNCRMLTHLTYRSHVDPITPQLMWPLGGGCPGITSLCVHPYPDCTSKNVLNNRCLLQIGQFFRDLQEVGLGGMEFDTAGLLPFIQSCQHLTTIHMDSCKPLTDDLATAMCRAGIKNLQTLTITGTAFQAKAITTLFSNCRQLKQIHATVTPQSCGLDMQTRKGRNEYKKLIKGYKELKKKAGLSNILTLNILEFE